MHILKRGALCSISMRPANLDIMSGDSAVFGDVLRGKHPHFSGWPPGPKLARRDSFSRCQHGPGGKHGITLNNRAIHHNSPHANKAVILQFAGMHQRRMTNRNIIADDGGKFTAADMNAAVILNICASTNGDIVIVAAHRHLIPNVAICANAHGPNHRRCWRDKGAIINFWHMIKKRRNMWWVVGIHYDISPYLMMGSGDGPIYRVVHQSLSSNHRF